MEPLYRNKWMRRAGLCVGVVFLALLWIANITALIHGRIWVGANYWRQPIDTWGQFIVLAAVTVFGGIWLVRNHRWWL